MDGSGATGMSIHTLGWFSASSVIRKLKEFVGWRQYFQRQAIVCPVNNEEEREEGSL